MKNIALGQYYPSDSPLHRMDGRFKIILSLLFIICSFLCRSALSFAALTVGTVILILISGIPFRNILKSVRMILFILLFTFIINMFFTKGDSDPLFEWKFISLYYEGIWNAAFMSLRILSLILGSSIFMSYTTTPIVLTDSIEQLLSPLKKIHIPVHDFAMMMSIALRFIPTLSDETDKIISAQKARGADFTTGRIDKRIKMLLPILIPLFASAIRRADELATAMECRCYHGGEGRSRMNVPQIHSSDILGLVFMLLYGSALIMLNNFSFLYVMK